MGIRARLSSLTKDFNWGVLVGQEFGYDLNSLNTDTKLITEYEIFYTPTQSFHILIYNKEGYYNPPSNNLLTRSKRKRFKGLQVIILCLLIFSYMWLNSTCNGKKSGVMEIICEYRVPLVIVVSLVVIVLLLIGSRYGTGKYARAKLKTN